MKKLKQFLAITVILLGNLQSVAQDKLNVTLRNDSVFLDNTFQFTAATRNSKSNQLIQLRAADSTLQAVLMVIPRGADTLRFSARFMKLDKMYDCYYPKMEMLTLYESYIRNKVMVNGVADEKGLQAYCRERKLELKAIPKKQVARPGAAQQDSILKARAEESRKAMVKIEISNTSEKAVTVMSGRVGSIVNGKRNYAEKRQEIIPAGERKVFTAFDGELICILMPDKSEKDCRTVTHALKSLTILSGGEGFGN